MHFLRKIYVYLDLHWYCLCIVHIFFKFSSQIMFILTLLDAIDPHETKNRTLAKSA